MKRSVGALSGYSHTRFPSIGLSLCLLLGLSSLAAFAERIPPGTDQEISARIEPLGSLCRQGEACGQAAQTVAGAAARSGQQIYNTTCMVCHAAGVSGAPKFGNPGDWAARIDKGLDTLWSHTQHGFNVMPPRGTCMKCSDEELKAAMNYMIDAAR